MTRTRRSAVFGAIVAALVSCPGCRPPARGGSPASPAPPRYAIAWATRVGGPGFDQLREVAIGADGGILVAGQASSDGLVVSKRAAQPKYGGEPPGRGHEGQVGGDAYVARVDPASGRVTAGTYLGGSRQERNVYGLAIAADGGVVITTATRSADAPTTKGAAQAGYGGGKADWLVAKLSSDLETIAWCTYLGGPGEDFPRGGLALAADGGVVVFGVGEPLFPSTPRGYVSPEGGARDVMVVRLSADGGAVEWCARLGTAGDDGVQGGAIALDGAIVVGGYTDGARFPVHGDAWQARGAGKTDGFVAVLEPDGRALRGGTLLGSSGPDYLEHRVAPMPDGSIWAAGACGAADVGGGKATRLGTLGRDDGVLACIESDGRGVRRLVLLGGSGGDNLMMPTSRGAAGVWFCGFTSSPDFPTTPDALRPYGGGPNDGILGAIAEDGSRVLFATHVGGSGDDVVRGFAFADDGAIILVGGTTSPDFPVTDGSRAAGSFDGFVMKLVPTAPASRR